jgi:hypothetical protein
VDRVKKAFTGNLAGSGLRSFACFLFYVSQLISLMFDPDSKMRGGATTAAPSPINFSEQTEQTYLG